MDQPESTAFRWQDLARHNPLPGINGSVRSGEQLSAAIFRLGPDAVVPRHAHPNEEFGQVLRGTLRLTVADRVSPLAAGDAFLIPADVGHAATAGPEGCELLECYAPPRNPFPQNQVPPHDHH